MLAAFAGPSTAQTVTMAPAPSTKVRFGTTQPGKVDTRGMKNIFIINIESQTYSKTSFCYGNRINHAISPDTNKIM